MDTTSDDTTTSGTDPDPGVATPSSDANDASPTSPPQSYLPSWVLEFRRKIDASRAQHASAESRLDTITTDLSSLDLSLLKLSKQPGGDDKARGVSDVDEAAAAAEVVNQRLRFPVHLVPMDVLALILEYLDVETIVGQLEVTSATVKGCVAECPYWARNITTLCPHVQPRRVRGRERLVITRHLKAGKSCLTFIRQMKEQRCVRRHDTIAPKRHNAKERSVTHPLPIFEAIRHLPNLKDARVPSSSSSSSLSSSSSSASSSTFTSDYIMSRANTLNSDFRAVALRTLEAMYDITCCYVDPLQLKFVEQGAITVLISLLSNEAGVVRHLSSSILANLLVWEARRNKVLRRRMTRIDEAAFEAADDDEDEDEDDFDVDDSHGDAEDSFKPLREQLEACGGKNMLVSLLTSPTASINLAGTTARVSGGLREKRMQASVEGVSSREAARALVTLFNPRKPVPAAQQAMGCDGLCEGACDARFASSHASAQAAAATAAATHFDAALRSQSFSSAAGGGVASPTTVASSPASPASPNTRLPPLAPDAAAGGGPGVSATGGRGRRSSWSGTYACTCTCNNHNSNNNPHAGAPGKGALGSSSGTKTSIVSSLFLSEDRARPWSFKYYHKSGSLKDAFTAYLFFTPDGFIRGRGVDGIGVFALFGQADADSEGGKTYFFHKLYVGEDVVHRPEPGDGFEEWCLQPGDHTIDARLQAWVTRAHIEYVFEGRTRTHVSHTGYWNGGVDVGTDARPGVRPGGGGGGGGGKDVPTRRRAAEETLGVWGMALYGVWETSSNQNHFDLQKGGVFRAEPILDYLLQHR